MGDGTRELLVRGIAAAKAGDFQEARFYLEWALRRDSGGETQIQAWYWLSEISLKPEEQRAWLEQILVLDPGHARARRKLAILDGRLPQEQVIDPDQLVHEAPAASEGPASGERFVCPNCGARLAFTADGQDLACDHCGYRRPTGSPAGRVEEPGDQDFIVTMATARGHRTATRVRTFVCPACGASYMLGPTDVSLLCAHCGATYVVDHARETELIIPDGLIPMAIPAGAARERVQGALAEPLRGVYLPAWLFEIGGRITRRRWVDDQRQRRQRLAEETEPILLSDVCVPATERLAEILVQAVQGFDFAGLVPYEPGYLADWAAETYSVPLSKAALLARQQAVRVLISRRPMNSRAREESFSSAGMQILTYRLILLPFWVAADCAWLINGQTGRPTGAQPSG
jgi:predicted RNA-binding Zn-ribbon protein involved in translation (DUF1610 family)